MNGEHVHGPCETLTHFVPFGIGFITSWRAWYGAQILDVDGVAELPIVQLRAFLTTEPQCALH